MLELVETTCSECGAWGETPACHLGRLTHCLGCGGSYRPGVDRAEDRLRDYLSRLYPELDAPDRDAFLALALGGEDDPADYVWLRAEWTARDASHVAELERESRGWPALLAEDPERVLERLRRGLPHGLLSSFVHRWTAMALTRLGRPSAEIRQAFHLSELCLAWLAGTGDGSLARPYRPTCVDDVYAFLAARGQSSEAVSLKPGPRLLEQHRLASGGVVWFDVSEHLRRGEARVA